MTDNDLQAASDSYIGTSEPATITTVEFLEALYGDAVSADRQLTLTGMRDRFIRSLHFASLTEAVEEGLTAASEVNVYFNVCLGQPEPGRRGGRDDVNAMPALTCDIDIRNDAAHKATDLAASVTDVLRFLDSLPLAPTVVVHSGNGVHAYWLLTKLMLLDSNSDRDAAGHLCRRWEQFLQHEAGQRGFKVDTTHSLARMLRLPGTLNHKTADDPKPVHVIRFDPEQRYRPDEFEAHFLGTDGDEENHQRQPGQAGEAASSSRWKLRPGDDYQARGDIRPVLQAAGWKRHGGPADNEYWLRPGKESGQHSATFDGNVFYVHSDRAQPFEGKAAYNKFEVYTRLEHDGNHTAAAAALAQDGFGEEETHPDVDLSGLTGSSKQPHEIDELGILSSDDDASQEDERSTLIPLGERDPETGKLVLSSKRTWPTARAFVRHHYSFRGYRTLVYYAGRLFAWRGNCYQEVEECLLTRELHPWLHSALMYSKDRNGNLELIPFPANPGTVNAALQSVQNHTVIPATTGIPSWLPGGRNDVDAKDILICPSHLLQLSTGQLLEPTPLLFATNGISFDPDAAAPRPQRWYEFLQQLFEDDLESVELLQEWFGYCLTGDTSLQKMLLIVGPRRAGKGTLSRVLSGLVGEANCCNPTVASFGERFGLWPLIGKTVAIVSDARFSDQKMATVVERLLNITGEDPITIDRKYLTPVTVRLGTRLMFLSNEIPRLSDASGALSGRFLVLQLQNSFYGEEDRLLEGKLRDELPGILNWSLEGRRRLYERGYFQVPTSSENALEELERSSSEIMAFIDDCCIVAPELRVTVRDLHQCWNRWRNRQGLGSQSSADMGRQLMAACTGMVTKRRNHVSGQFYDGIGVRA